MNVHVNLPTSNVRMRPKMFLDDEEDVNERYSNIYFSEILLETFFKILKK